MKNGNSTSKKFPVFIIVLVILFTSCAHVPRVNQQGLPQREYIYQVPEDAGDGWETSSLLDEDIEPAIIHEMMHAILLGTPDIFTVFC